MEQQIITMLELQDEMNEKVHSEWRKQNFAWYLAIWIESAELMDHYGWKWWKKQSPDKHQITLELVGVGYRAALKGNQLNLQLGYSHDINFDIPEGIKITVEKQTILKISGSDKQLVGEVVSKIKTLRKIEPYKGKGVREKGQYVLKKEGKKK